MFAAYHTQIFRDIRIK